MGRPRSVWDNFFFLNDSLDEPKQMLLSKNVLSFWEVGQKRKMVIKSNLPVSHSPEWKIFPFKKDFKKWRNPSVFIWAYYGHTKPIFKALGILTIHNLILTQLLPKMHKIYSLLAPAYKRSLFSAHYPFPLNPCGFLTHCLEALILTLAISCNLTKHTLLFMLCQLPDWPNNGSL